MTVLSEILEKIKKYETIIIHRHQRPDPDAFGSQSGLALIIKESFPKKKVYCVGKKVDSLEWIEISDDLKTEQYNGALVIVLDTANVPRIDDERYELGDFLIKIDHHPNDDDYGDLSWVEVGASSTSEMIVDLVNVSNHELALSKNAAEKLYAGIVGDTGRFMYDATTSHTMVVASQLMEQGIDAPLINRRLDGISEPVARLSAYVLEKMVITQHKAAYITIKREVMDKYGLGDSQTAQIVPLVGKINDVLCWVVMVQTKDGSYRLRIRSKGPIINELAKEYGGGGHPLASGAVLNNNQNIKKFVEKLDKIAQRYEENR